jgi:MFS family permease
MSTYRRVLRHRNFRNLFLGQSASAVGDQVVIVALALYITQRTGSPTDLGVVLAAQSLPMVALLLFGGVWADRLPRHRIMIAADLVRALLHAVLAVLILNGGASVGEMVVIEALFGAARAFFQPAYTGLMPQTISEEHKQDAWALSATTANLAILVGPALGTALVLGLGAGEAFAFDAATFVLSAVLLARVRPRIRISAAPPPARQSLVAELRAGFQEVVSRPWVAVTIAAFAGAVLTCYAQYYALAPVIARDVYGGAGVFGVLESVAGGGAVVGALVGIRWRPRRPMFTGLMLTLVWPVAAFTFALGAPLVAVVPMVFSVGFGFSLFGIWWEASLARNVPPHALSRVSAYDWMGSLALMPLGFAIAGPLAAALGERTVLAAGSVVAFVLLALAMTPRSTRQLSGADADATAGRSAEQGAGDIGVELGGEAEVADVDSLVGAVD